MFKEKRRKQEIPLAKICGEYVGKSRTKRHKKNFNLKKPRKEEIDTRIGSWNLAYQTHLICTQLKQHTHTHR